MAVEWRSEVLNTETQWKLHMENEDRWPVLAPHVCHICEKVVLDIRKSAKLLLESEKDDLSTIPSTNSELMLLDLLTGARSGCAFFQKLSSMQPMLASIFHRMHMPIDQSHLAHLIFEVSLWSDDSGVAILRADDAILWRNGQREIWPGHYFPKKPPCIQFYINNGHRWPCPDPVIGTFGLHETPRKISSSLIGLPKLPPNLLPSSELSFSRATSWLKSCQDSHTSCQASVRTYTPKRLLEIRDGGERIVLRTDSCIKHYAALSYCWGGEQPARTTEARLQFYSSPFASQSLPATIRDAVQVTCGLGFRHLWVDSMCIIQDNAEDVTEQVAEMYNIFRGASITIVASNAKTAADGFLHLRTEYRPYMLPAGKDYDLESQIILSPLNVTQLYDTPRFTRAWCFQELHLSARHIAYGPRNMVFTCLEAEYEDGGHSSIVDNGICQPGCKDLDGETHPRGWANLIKQYSTLRLSKQTDRLPALGALAEEYAQRHKLTDYVAGLWADDFLWQLLWFPSLSRSDGLAKRMEEYCAPTWSWCSLTEQQIDMPRTGPEEFHMTAVLIEINVHLLSKRNLYGRVTSAWLKIRGRTRLLSKPGHMIRSRSPHSSGADDEERSSHAGANSPDLGSQDLDLPDIDSPDLDLPDIGSPHMSSPDIDSSNIDSLDRLDRRFFKLNFDEHDEWSWPARYGIQLLALEIGCYVTRTSVQGADEEENTTVEALVLRHVSDMDESSWYERVGILTTVPGWFNHETVTEREVIII